MIFLKAHFSFLLPSTTITTKANAKDFVNDPKTFFPLSL